jgi:FkbM family methyltransferase
MARIRKGRKTNYCSNVTIYFMSFVYVVYTHVKIPSQLDVKEKQTMGFCEYYPYENSTNQPHKVSVGDYVDVETQYKQDYWDQVDFPPVPSFFINTHNPKTQDIYISGTVHAHTHPWDVFIWDLMSRILISHDKNDNKVVLDVGANIGYFSLMAASLGCKVISIEPMSRNVAKLISSIKKNKMQEYITVYQNVAAPISKGMVFLTETHQQNQGNGKITVKDLSKTQIYDSYGIDYVYNIALSDVVDSDVYFMKIDVEGFETFVLDGCYKLLCKNKIPFITMEVSEDTKRNLMCSIMKMLQTMQALGYVVSDVTPHAIPLNIKELYSFPPNILFTLQNKSLKSREDICNGV